MNEIVTASERATPAQAMAQARLWAENNKDVSDEARKKLRDMLVVGPIHNSLLSELRDEFDIPKPVTAWVKLWDEFTYYAGKASSPNGQPAVALSEKKDDPDYWAKFRKTLTAGGENSVSPWVSLGLPAAATVCGPVRMEMFCAFLRNLDPGGEEWLLMSEVCAEFQKTVGMHFQDFFQGRKAGEVSKSYDGQHYCEWQWSTHRPPLLSVRRQDRIYQTPLQALSSTSLRSLRRIVRTKTPEMVGLIGFQELAEKYKVDKDSVYFAYLKELGVAIERLAAGRAVASDGGANAAAKIGAVTGVAGGALGVAAAGLATGVLGIVAAPAALAAGVGLGAYKWSKFLRGGDARDKEKGSEYEGGRLHSAKDIDTVEQLRCKRDSLERELLTVHQKIDELQQEFRRQAYEAASASWMDRLSGDVEYRKSRMRSLESELTRLQQEKFELTRIEQGIAATTKSCKVIGTIVSLCASGARVDVDGTPAWLPLSEMSWDYVSAPDEVVQVGMTYDFVPIPDRDGEGRLIVSLKRKIEDPWQTAASRFPIGTIAEGVVLRYTKNDDGLVVSLAPGITGFLPLQELPVSIRKDTASASVEKKSVVRVAVIGLNRDDRKILLSMNTTTSGRTEQRPLNAADRLARKEVESIVSQVASLFNLEAKQLMTASVDGETKLARSLAMYLAHTRTNGSLKGVADVFNIPSAQVIADERPIRNIIDTDDGKYW